MLQRYFDEMIEALCGNIAGRGNVGIVHGSPKARTIHHPIKEANHG
jgi:hypothetical protein